MIGNDYPWLPLIQESIWIRSYASAFWNRAELQDTTKFMQESPDKNMCRVCE